MAAEKLCNQVKTNGEHPYHSTNPFEKPGVRVLCNTKGFIGFQIYYDAQDISSLGILRKNSTSPATWVSPILRYDSPGCCVMDVSLKKVEEVVGDFEVCRALYTILYCGIRLFVC